MTVKHGAPFGFPPAGVDFCEKCRNLVGVLIPLPAKRFGACGVCGLCGLDQISADDQVLPQQLLKLRRPPRAKEPCKDLGKPCGVFQQPRGDRLQIGQPLRDAQNEKTGPIDMLRPEKPQLIQQSDLPGIIIVAHRSAPFHTILCGKESGGNPVYGKVRDGAFDIMN